MTLRKHDTQTPLPTEPEAETDPFYYGHRFVITQDETGEEVYIQQPLSLEDFLDPQEGDHFLQGTLHNTDVEKVWSIFRKLHRDEPTTAVFSDLKIIWDIEGLSRPAPDVVVIPNVTNPEKPRGSFDVAIEGTRPRFVLEMVSPLYREPDRQKKVGVYETAGVEEYIIIDSWLAGEVVAYEVLGYRLAEAGFYTEIPPDKRGWIYSATNHVWIGVNVERDGFFIVDAETGEKILPAEVAREEAEQQLQVEAEARQAAERQAQTAERQAQTEAEARQTAERQAQTEAEARQTAERQAQAEAEARQTAEHQAQAATRQAQAEAEARRQAEQREQSLAAELARMREELARARQSDE